MSDEHESAERMQAQRESCKCQFCGGAGLATAFHPDYDGNDTLACADADRGEFKIAGRCSCHCVCSLGRWMRSKTSLKMLDRVPDFTAILTGHSSWLSCDPRPMPDDTPTFRRGNYRDTLRRMMRVPSDIQAAANHAEEW